MVNRHGHTVVLITSIVNIVLLKEKFIFSFLEVKTAVRLLVLYPTFCGLWKDWFLRQICERAHSERWESICVSNPERLERTVCGGPHNVIYKCSK